MPLLELLPYLLAQQYQKPHWAEKIFDNEPQSSTELRHRRQYVLTLFLYLIFVFLSEFAVGFEN
jgi:hypothetical protein